MNAKTLKSLSTVVYIVGVVVFLALLTLVIFGANIVPYPEAMIAYSLRDMAVIGLAFGTIPMLLSCMAFYKFNNIKNSVNRKRKFILIFTPCFTCAICALFIAGVIVYGIIHMI